MAGLLTRICNMVGASPIIPDSKKHIVIQPLLPVVGANDSKQAFLTAVQGVLAQPAYADSGITVSGTNNWKKAFCPSVYLLDPYGRIASPQSALDLQTAITRASGKGASVTVTPQSASYDSYWGAFKVTP